MASRSSSARPGLQCLGLKLITSPPSNSVTTASKFLPSGMARALSRHHRRLAPAGDVVLRRLLESDGGRRPLRLCNRRRREDQLLGTVAVAALPSAWWTHRADHWTNSGCRSMPLGITPQQASSARWPTRKAKPSTSRRTRTPWRISTILSCVDAGSAARASQPAPNPPTGSIRMSRPYFLEY